MSEVQLNGTLAIGPYKGYHGRVEFDADAGLFYGKVTETRDVITFAGRDPSELKVAFTESVDDYLAFCKERGEAPDKPYSGKFLVRTTPQLHQELARIAENSGKSLNQFVLETLKHAAKVYSYGSLEGVQTGEFVFKTGGGWVPSHQYHQYLTTTLPSSRHEELEAHQAMLLGHYGSRISTQLEEERPIKRGAVGK